MLKTTNTVWYGGEDRGILWSIQHTDYYKISIPKLISTLTHIFALILKTKYFSQILQTYLLSI